MYSFALSLRECALHEARDSRAIDAEGHPKSMRAALCRRAHERMSAWCLGARRRRAETSDFTCDSSYANDVDVARMADARRVEEERVMTRAREDAAHARGTTRARACLSITVVIACVLGTTRSYYGPYIDVFGPKESASEQTTTPATTTPTELGATELGASARAKARANEAFQRGVDVNDIAKSSRVRAKTNATKMVHRKVIG